MVCRVFAMALVCAATPGLAAQSAAPGPRLTITREDAPKEEPWRAGSRLAFAVVLSHPCMTGAPFDEDFVLDPDGGYAKAIELVATDAGGATVPLRFTKQGGSDTGALVLHRFDRRTLWFELDGDAAAPRIVAGPMQITARLHTDTGAWRGTATSAPMVLDVRVPSAPELALLGSVVTPDSGSAPPTAGSGTLYRDWPACVSVAIRVPDGGDPVLLPAQPEEWPNALQLSLQSESGDTIADACRQLPVGQRPRSRLEAGQSCVVQFQVRAAITARLADGRYRWTATFRAMPAANGESGSVAIWSGSTVATAWSRCVSPPDPLPPSLIWEHERALVRDDLADGIALRAEAEHPVGYLNDRRRTAENAAAKLCAAERRAIAFLKDHPDDDAVCLLLAEVSAAADDIVGARLFAGRAVAVELAARRARATAAGQDPEQEEPSLQLAMLADDIANGGRPLDVDLQAAFHSALAAQRQGGSSSSNATSPVATDPAQSEPAKPVSAADAVAGTVSNGDAATLDARFAADANGQWAAHAVASSQYGTENYSAARATGAPDVSQHGDNANAWAPGTADGGAERLTLTFASASKATAVRVRQSCQPGAITHVELIGQGGERLVAFDGVDPGKYQPGAIGWFVVEFPAPKFPVVSVELGFDTSKVAGWNEIDAVQLAGEPIKH